MLARRRLMKIDVNFRQLQPFGRLTDDSWLTGQTLLPPVPAAEAGHAAGDDHHEADGDTTDDEEKLEIDLTLLAGEPRLTLTLNLVILDVAHAIAAAQVARLGRLGCKIRTLGPILDYIIFKIRLDLRLD